MRLALMGCQQANREGPRVTQNLLPYSRKHGARIARLRCPILRDSKGTVTFCLGRFPEKMNDETQLLPEASKAINASFEKAQCKLPPTFGTITKNYQSYSTIISSDCCGRLWLKFQIAGTANRAADIKPATITHKKLLCQPSFITITPSPQPEIMPLI